MDFSKFVSLLYTQKLHFARVSDLKDEHEGSLSNPSKRLFGKKFENGRLKKSRQRLSEIREEAKKEVFVNCWHMSKRESAFMWSLYGGVGRSVAIQSTCQRLIDVLPKCCPVGAIRYIDYESANENDRIPEHNYLYPFMHKRASFRHEEEIRAIYWNPEAPFALEHNGPFCSLDGRIQRTETGVSVPIDISKLVQCVYISPKSPKWFKQLLLDILIKYGFNISTVRSSLDAKPIY